MVFIIINGEHTDLLLLLLLLLCVCLNRLQAAGQHERAAAVALFNNKIREAIEILSSQKANKNTGGKVEVLVYYCTRKFSCFRVTAFV